MRQPFLNLSLVAFGAVSLVCAGFGIGLEGRVSWDLAGTLLILAAWKMQTRTAMKTALGLQALYILGSVSLLILGNGAATELPSFLHVARGPETWGMAFPFLGWGIVNSLGLIRELRENQPVRAAA